MEIFVYGTLTEPERVASIVDTFVFVGAAVLDGCHPVAGRYPTLAPGGETAGRLLRTDEIDAIDTYEGVDEGLYVRVPTARSDGGTVAVYVGDPDALDVEEVIDWPGPGPFAERVRRYFEAESVAVRPEHS